MSILHGIRDHYGALGLQGVWLASKARVTGWPIQVTVEVPGLKHPVHVRLRTQDLSPLRQVYVHAEYDWGFTPDPRVIVDAGANTGMTSVFFANRYPAATVISIEPDAANYEILRENVAAYPNVVPIRAALWHEDKDVCVIDPGCGHDAFRTQDSPGANGSVRGIVRAVCLRTLMRDVNIGQIDLLKVDIEGAESEVFGNASAWISSVDTIAIELHDRLKPDCSRVVASATRDFSFRWQRGETLILARRAEAVDRISAAKPAHAHYLEGKHKLPMRIVAQSRGKAADFEIAKGRS